MPLLLNCESLSACHSLVRLFTFFFHCRMAEKGVFLTPTLACYGIMVRPPFEDFLPPEGKVKNAQVMERGLDALKIADEAGVTIC